MQKLRSNLSNLLFFAALVLELILVAGRVNSHRSRGGEAGPWAIRLPVHHGNGSFVLAWVVLLLAAIVFVRFAGQGKILMMGAVIGAAVLFELLFARELPFPQNSWVVAVAWLIGVLQVLWEIISNSQFRDRLRAGLGRLGLSF
jgi:hypothetical protein